MKESKKRKHLILSVSALIIALIMMLSVAQMSSAHVVRLSLQELTLEADLILQGTVLSKESAWNYNKSMIFTQVTLAVKNVVKGSAFTGTFVIQVPGGIVDDIGLMVSDTPEFTEGEEVVVFLKADHAAVYRVLGGFQGKYSVSNGWAQNKETMQVITLHSLIKQIVKIMNAHGFSIILEPGWEFSFPQASGPSPDLRRTIINDFVYNDIHWPDPDPMGEDYIVNTNIVDGDITSSQALSTIQAAANTWNAVSTSYFVFSYGGSSSATYESYNDLNEILFQDGGMTGTLATTYTWYYTVSLIIVECDQVINDSYDWDVTGFPSSEEFDLQSVVLHEFGHYLMLGHDPEPAAVMYYATSAGEVQRTLHQNDMDGISFIYPFGVQEDDLLGTWSGQGVYYRNSDTESWIILANPATQITAGDIDNDGTDDLIGIWPGQGGVWLRYSSTGSWVLLSSSAVWVGSGDMNGDGRDDFLGTWSGQGVYYRNSATGSWVEIASPATQITAGDIDNDGTADLIGIWPGQGGVWIKYSSTGSWALLSSTAVWIGTGDMNGDGREDLIGTWTGQGVYYRDSATETWVKIATPATQIAAGDLDGDGTDDLVGIWPGQGGVWVKYSITAGWARLSSTADWIACGKMRSAGGSTSTELTLSVPIGGFASGPSWFERHEDLSSTGPGGWNFVFEGEADLIPQMHRKLGIGRIPGPGEPGFKYIEQKNLVPGQSLKVKRDRKKK